MAKIKCEINEDSTLVKFEAIENGEVFMYNGEVLYKFNDFATINLVEDRLTELNNNTLVTYVKSAELKLTI